MRSILLICFFCTVVMVACAQRHDYTWHLGFGDYVDDPLDSIWGRSVMDFNQSLGDYGLYYNGSSFMDYDLTNASISDSAGRYLFSYNGVYVEDASHQPMQNGLAMSDSGYEGGDVLPQGGLILPLPGSDNRYVLFHQSRAYIGTFGVAGHKVYYSVIDMNENNGLGAVVEKRNLLITDTLDWGKLTAVKHANGRDWWVVVPRYDSDEFYRLLLEPSGPTLYPIQSVGVTHIQGLGQAFFSPNGERYAIYSADGYPHYLDIYDFDRCNGLLSNPISYSFSGGNNAVGGVVFSPNSSLLYLLAYHEIYQFDLTADDVLGSRRLAAVRDNYLDTIPNTGFYVPHTFFLGQLAPDGKIYVNSIGSVRVLTTIDYPDVWGPGCGVNQHSVHLPTVNTSLPNFPNYRLGPLDGSACDTLGLDNLPLARFRADQDTADYLSFRFINLSDYEPETWLWTFGDGQESTERHPDHGYAAPGIYPVCLTAANAYGSHTSCDTLYLGITTTLAEPAQAAGPMPVVFPNPVGDYVQLAWPDGYYPRAAEVVVLDALGRQVYRGRLPAGVHTIHTAGWPSGWYIYQVSETGRPLGVGRMIKP